MRHDRAFDPPPPGTDGNIMGLRDRRLTSEFKRRTGRKIRAEIEKIEPLATSKRFREERYRSELDGRMVSRFEGKNENGEWERISVPSQVKKFVPGLEG